MAPVVTFQDGLIDMFERHAVKGRLVYVEGKLQTRRWSKPGEDGDRFSTEILLVPGGRVQFLDRPNGNGAAQASDAQAMPDAAVAANGAGQPANSRTIRKSRSSGHIVSSRLGRRFARRPIFLAAGPEPGPSGLRARAALGLRALRRRREAKAGRYRASRMH